MNSKTIKFFDVKWNKTIETNLCGICLISGNDCGTAKSLFRVIENKFDESPVPMNGLSIENTNTMIGKYNSMTLNSLKKNSNVFIEMFQIFQCSNEICTLRFLNFRPPTSLYMYESFWPTPHTNPSTSMKMKDVTGIYFANDYQSKNDKKCSKIKKLWYKAIKKYWIKTLERVLRLNLRLLTVQRK